MVISMSTNQPLCLSKVFVHLFYAYIHMCIYMHTHFVLQTRHILTHEQSLKSKS